MYQKRCFGTVVQGPRSNPRYFPSFKTRPRGARAYAVSIHAPARGATQAVLIRLNCSFQFQSTRPRGARRVIASSLSRPSRFVSIHAPARGATRYTDCSAGFCAVSIHAPARGATSIQLHRLLCAGLLVSIHAPARGATSRQYRHESRVEILFQSTRPRGARQPRDATCNSSADVSIHAPARGATIGKSALVSMIMFQSTRPRGARRGTSSVASVATGFNPRARAGRDNNW